MSVEEEETLREAVRALSAAVEELEQAAGLLRAAGRPGWAIIVERVRDDAERMEQMVDEELPPDGEGGST